MFTFFTPPNFLIDFIQFLLRLLALLLGISIVFLLGPFTTLPLEPLKLPSVSIVSRLASGHENAEGVRGHGSDELALKEGEEWPPDKAPRRRESFISPERCGMRLYTHANYCLRLVIGLSSGQKPVYCKTCESESCTSGRLNSICMQAPTLLVTHHIHRALMIILQLSFVKPICVYKTYRR